MLRVLQNHSTRTSYCHSQDSGHRRQDALHQPQCYRTVDTALSETLATSWDRKCEIFPKLLTLLHSIEQATLRPWIMLPHDFYLLDNEVNHCFTEITS